jgi:hypothetical protein
VGHRKARVALLNAAADAHVHPPAEERMSFDLSMTPDGGCEVRIDGTAVGRIEPVADGLRLVLGERPEDMEHGVKVFWTGEPFVMVLTMRGGKGTA